MNYFRNPLALLAVALAIIVSDISAPSEIQEAIQPGQLSYARSVPTISLRKPDQVVSSELIELISSKESKNPGLLQRAIGMAEGTREDSGIVNQAYYGHRDPMCFMPGVPCPPGDTNLGSFSYQQHPAKPVAMRPDVADRVQIEILRIQALELVYQAERKGMRLTVHELLQGLDLANQAPEAACVKQPDKMLVYKLSAGIDRASNTAKARAVFKENKCQWGFLDRLKQARDKKGLSGIEAIVEARKWSFFDPDSMRWSASGLGNSVTRIEQDQRRRALAVQKGLESYLKLDSKVLLARI
ncbi:hypothetical protein GC174_15090 [bacterium]|nr:hypothetical protein [bacterium]